MENDKLPEEGKFVLNLIDLEKECDKDGEIKKNKRYSEIY